MSNSMFNQSQSPNASETNAGLVKKATAAQAAAKQDDDGGVPLYVPPSLALSGSRDFVASENLTIGQPVGLSVMFPGVARARRSGVTVAHGVTSPVAILKNGIHIPIGPNKVVTFTYTTAASDTLFAQVVEFNPDTLSATVGTASAVATTFTPVGNWGSQALAVCKLDTDKFVVFYLKDASATQVLYRVGTVSGNTISWGVEANAVLSASTLATTATFIADQIATDKGVFLFTANTVTDSRVIAFTASGTVLTFGVAVAPTNSTRGNYFAMIKKIATDKFVIVNNIGSTNIYAVVGTLSGTAITLGVEQRLSASYASASALNINDLISPTDDAFIYKTGYSPISAPLLLSFTVVGTVMTLATAKTDIPSTSSSNMFIKDGLLYLVAQNRLYKFTLTGAVISGSSSPEGLLYQFPGEDFRGFNLGTYAVAVYPFLALTYYWIEGMSSNWLGIAQETVVKGATVKVLLSGIDENQSNLIPGGLYKVDFSGGHNDTGALVLRDSLAIGTGTDDIKYGIALTDTDLLI